MVEVEHELEEAMHLVFLYDARLTQSAHNLKKRLPLFNFKLLDSHVSQVYYHDVVAQISLIKANLCVI